MSLGVRSILGMRVDATSYADASRRIADWARDGRSAYVCVANVHMTMETVDSPGFRRVVNGADLVTPDGRPLVWALRWLGVRDAVQVRGAGLIPYVAETASREGIPLGLYGSTPEVLDDMARVLKRKFPKIEVVCRISPPFRELKPEEDEEFVREISDSGARIVLVGLGCPKQERWMADHRGRVPAVMIGVGAAFDFYTGRTSQAPRWMQVSGLEWLHRLQREPRRLWRRYATTNPRFVALLALQLSGVRNLIGRGGSRG